MTTQTEIYQQCYAADRAARRERDMNKLLRARATRWARALILAKHTVRNWTHADAKRYLELAWLAGARSMDAWHRQQTRKPVGLNIHAMESGTLEHGMRVTGAGLPEGTVLTIPALNSSEPRPRPKVGQDVRLLVVRECFQVHLKVGDVGEVIKDDGGLLTVQWRTGRVPSAMWIDADDVAVVERAQRPTYVACGWPCNSVGTCSNLGCPDDGGDA